MSTAEQHGQSASVTLGLLETGRGGVLDGVVVIELSATLAGEFAGGLLADMGATVIKIEPPEGSPMRRLGPAIDGEDSLYFQSENRGKYSVCAELQALQEEPWLARLLSLADAIVEDLGPGVMEAAGLSPEVLQARHPPLCLLRISPFGQSGPLAAEGGDDRIAQAFSGTQFLTGFADRPPIPVTLPIADCWSGVHGANGLLISIIHARRSGHGQVVDLGLYETLLRMQEAIVINFDQHGAVASRTGTESPTVVPANIYATRDGGLMALSGAGDQPFARLCQAIEAPEAVHDPRFSTPAARLQNRAAADSLVGAWIAAHDLAEVEERFSAVGVAGTTVLSVDEIIANPHIQARRSYVQLRSQSGQAFVAPASVPRFSRTSTRDAECAPKLGEHTTYIRSRVEAIAAAPSAVVRSESGSAPTAALSGIRVLDLSQWLAGPAAASMLADFGADVIMVELPLDGPQQSSAGRALSFLVTNRNKRSITLDVRTARGREAFLDLVRVSDVVVENFRPGTLERWDLGADQLLGVNPQLVLLRASGFGQTGPYSRRPAFNPVGLAFGGLTYLNGWPDRSPVRDGVQAGDYTTALFNVLGVLGALLRRERDGEGQVVDTAMYEAVLRMSGDLLAVRSALGIRRERASGQWPLYPICLTLEGADQQFVAVSIQSWQDALPRLEQLGIGQLDSASQAHDKLAQYVALLPAEEAVRALRRVGLMASRVNSVADLVADPHLWHRENLVRLSDPKLGEVVTQGVIPILSRTPGRVAGWSAYRGSDNEAVFEGLLGYTAEQMRQVTEPRGQAGQVGGP
ncbi:MAG: CoA transferase [bacterium]|nr:CoA transferase [bacterium]